MMLRVLYRISDKGNIKNKVGVASKLNCLKNFIDEFGKEYLYLFADNCSGETIEEIRKIGIEPYELSLGNSRSFRYVLDFAINNFEDSDCVYFVEDDYWHLSLSRSIILEGLKLGDYVSLYDHPDKYISFLEGGPNPYIVGNYEESKVLLSPSCHWKTTNSVPMTFASRVCVLKEDRKVFLFFTRKSVPNDFGIFVVLTKQSIWPLFKNRRYYFLILSILMHIFKKKRRLITSLPAYSTHTEALYIAPLSFPFLK